MNAKKEKRSLPSFLYQVPIIFWGLLLLIVVLGFVSPNSVMPKHLLDFSRQSSPLILVSLGQLIVMMVGGLDLSVGNIMILTTVVAAQTMNNSTDNIFKAVFLCLFIGIVIGFANGILCAVLKMPAFVVTLGMSTLLLGLTLVYCDGSPKGSIPQSFRYLGTGFLGIIPMAAIVWLIIGCIMFVIMQYTPIGRYIRATGINPKAVHQSGIDNVKVQLLCYIICAVLAVIAGLAVAAYTGTGSLELGDDYQQRSIAVALLGGASFSGGRGQVIDTALAGLFIIIMYSLIAVLNMDAGDRSIIQGIIILAGLLLNNFKRQE